MDKPIACDLNAIPVEQRQGHVALTEALFSQVEERQALAAGYAFGFPATLLLVAAQFVSLERLCCPFFNFNLDVSDDRLWLRLTGPEGAKELLEVEFHITPEV
ncbi:MAG: hypothetical protein ABI970_05470 [Chloroflexota bacterium]